MFLISLSLSAIWLCFLFSFFSVPRGGALVPWPVCHSLPRRGTVWTRWLSGNVRNWTPAVFLPWPWAGAALWSGPLFAPSAMARPREGRPWWTPWVEERDSARAHVSTVGHYILRLCVLSGMFQSNWIKRAYPFECWPFFKWVSKYEYTIGLQLLVSYFERIREKAALFCWDPNRYFLIFSLVPAFTCCYFPTTAWLVVPTSDLSGKFTVSQLFFRSQK